VDPQRDVLVGFLDDIVQLKAVMVLETMTKMVLATRKYFMTAVLKWIGAWREKGMWK
jgi:hypothetical protein